VDDKPKRKSHWTIPRMAKREALIESLRKDLERIRPNDGDRQNGMLTTAQIFDWGLEELRASVDEFLADLKRGANPPE